MTVGIVTFHNAHNYGAVLQAYALASVLKKMGLNVNIVNFNNPKITKPYHTYVWRKDISIKTNLKNLVYRKILRHGHRREKEFDSFIKELPLTQLYYHTDEIPEIFDVLISGSDQVWNDAITGAFYPFYFLQFSHHASKISYAASSGNHAFMDRNPETLSFLQDFHAIGIREESTKKYVETKLQIPVTLNPDPTLLLRQDDWKNIETPITHIKDDFLLFYTASMKTLPFVLPFIRKVANHKHLKLAVINYERRKHYWGYSGVDYNLNEISPKEFVWLFDHAKYIVSNSFHGNAFSVIFRKDFVYFSHEEANDDRIRTLHHAIGLGDSRTVRSFAEFLDKDKSPLIYQEEIINSYIHSGYTFLQDSILIKQQ